MSLNEKIVEESISKIKKLRTINTIHLFEGRKYYLQNISNKCYIILDETSKTKIKDKKETINLLSDKNLFLSFIATIPNKTVDQYLDFKKNAKDFKDFTEKESKDVIDWCNNYGLLDIDRMISEKMNITCFPLETFYDHAIKLRTMYYIWVSLRLDEVDDAIKYSNDLLKYWDFTDVISNIDDVKGLIPEIVDNCNSYILDMCIIFNSPTLFTYDNIDAAESKNGRKKSYKYYFDSPLWNVTADTILEVLYFQFLCLLCNTVQEGFSQLRSCVYCGCDFWGDIRSFYCPNCKRSTTNDRYKSHTEKLTFTLDQRLKNKQVTKEIKKALEFLLSDSSEVKELLELSKISNESNISSKK